MTTRDAIVDFMRERAYKPLTAGELAKALGVARNERPAFAELLEAMEAEGQIVRTRADRYGVPERMSLVVGRLQGHPRGFGFVVPADPARAEPSGGKDVFVPAEALGGALHGDQVVVRVHGRGTRDSGSRERGPDGEIIRVLRRANPTMVGTFEPGRGFGLVVPDERRVARDIVIPRGEENGAQPGDRVMVEITRWPEARRNPEGRIIERLGAAGAPGVDILAIIRRFGLPEAFPEAVLAEAERVPDLVAEAELAGRLDLRDRLIITIDGADAKDLDDAVSVEERPDGLLELGVHIADVSHYVREGSALDAEARERATSVYLVDRVLPMLPPKLSNGICSLNPRVDRLTLSCFVTFTPEGEPREHRFARSVIRSRERMTYEDVAKILVEKSPLVTAHYRDLVPTLRTMERLAMALRAQRMRRGSLDFDFPETKVRLDEAGRPVALGPYPRTLADQIIEEFMLAANETVASHAVERGWPFLYRIHEPPDAARLEALNEFLFHFGLHLKDVHNIAPRALQAILKKVEGRPEASLIETMVLRSLKLARYSAEPKGHFGLAARYYTHFTSPIRRYPDLWVHRILWAALERGDLPARERDRLARVLPGVADKSSERERRAEEAERETVGLKRVEFMLDKVGEVFDAVVTGVQAYGLFVALENTVEGLVHVSTMTDDYYDYDERHMALTGQHTGRRFVIGDPVRVQVTRVSVEDRQVDFRLMAAEADEFAGYRLFGGRRPGAPAEGEAGAPESPFTVAEAARKAAPKRPMRAAAGKAAGANGKAAANGPGGARRRRRGRRGG